MKSHMLERPEWTYWFERDNGSYFCVKAREASNIIKGRIQVAGYERPRYKYVGRSTGQLFYEATKEAQKLFSESQDIEKAQQLLRDAQEAEYQAAQQDKTLPPDFDTMGDRGQPVDLGQL